jgi:twinkle protein
MMIAKEITHKPCPHVECDSSDAFAFNSEKKTGFCHSCERTYPMKGMNLKSWVKDEYPLEEITRTLKTTEIEGLGDYVTYRGVRKDVMEFFGVQTFGFNQVYKYPSGFRKVRNTKEKSFKTDKGFKTDELFGMDKFNAGSSRSVVVCEGELDAMSAFQMLDKKYPCVSVPSATPNQKLWQGKSKEWIDSFDRIVLSVDNDEAGRALATKIGALFPKKTYQIIHDKYKDANEFLEGNAKPSYAAAFYNAKRYTPDNIRSTPEQFLELFEKQDDAIFVSTGIESFDDVALGLMQGHFTVFQAPEGIGKTEFMRYLEHHVLTEHKDISIAICHLEETEKRSVLGLVSYDLNMNLTRKDLIQEHDMEEEVKQSIIDLTKDERLYQFQIAVDEDPMDILEKIRYFREACGVSYVFFEPIQDLAYSRKGDETVEKWLSGLSVQLSRLASELNVGIVTIAHENDDGQVRDCRTIAKRASVVVKLERDKMAEDRDERNTTKLLLVKNRPAGKTGFAGKLIFNEATFKLSEDRGRWS